MARRRRKNKGGRGWLLDLTEIKFGAMLFKKHQGPQAIQQLMQKNVSGAFNTYGSGDLGQVAVDSISTGLVAKVRRRMGLYTVPWRGKRGKIRL